MSSEVFVPSGYRADHLMRMELPEPRVVVEGIAPEGCVILGGRPKIGKSWLLLLIALSVATGSRLFGLKATDHGDVAYLALEDNPRRLQARMTKLLRGPLPTRLWFFTERARLDRGGLEALDLWLYEHPDARLVIIDTLAKIKPRRGKNADPYDHDHTVMSSLTELAGRHRVCIIICHHTRKAESDDFIDALSGTLGLSGGTDAVLVLKRSRGQADATLSITGRDIEDQELALAFDGASCVWSLLGDAEDYRLGEARREIVEAMQRNGQPMKPVDVAAALDKNRNTIRWHMAAMAKDGTLKAWDDGKYTVNSLQSSQQGQQGNHPKQYPHPNGTDVGADGSVEGVGPVGPVGSYHLNGRGH